MAGDGPLGKLPRGIVLTIPTKLERFRPNANRVVITEIIFFLNMLLSSTLLGVGFQKGLIINVGYLYIAQLLFICTVQKAYCLRLALSKLVPFTLEHFKGNKNTNHDEANKKFGCLV